MKSRLAGLAALFLSIAGAQVKDISGTWVAKISSPMGGEMEIVYRLKVDTKGNITGSQSLPFGDAPILSGAIHGDEFEFTVEVESFGNLQQRQVKGKIVGDALELTLAMPGPPPGMGGPAGGPTGGPGRPPRMPRIVTARRGVPMPSYRITVDYKTLPHVDLPELKPVASIRAARTPPMGWNSWNKFHTRIDDKTVRQIADAMVDSGMLAAGYQYVIIDDGWQMKRDGSGVLQPNPQFPDMKALTAYVHGKGLKLGIYSSPGPQTCGGYAGSYGHEEIDAKTWADWGVDYLKYDWCSASRVWKDQDMHVAYQRMGEALHKTGRPIVFALCQYGRAKVTEWGPQVGASLWRTTRDIQDHWDSMIQIGLSQNDLKDSVKPGSWNDPDMLEIGNGGMSADEYKTHFSLWAMISAPLIAGNDVRAMTPEIKEILLNREAIAVNQDALGSGGYRLKQTASGEIWCKRLSGGNYAVAFINTGANEASMQVSWADVGLTGTPQVRDVWKHADLIASKDSFEARVPAHGTVMLVAKQP